jgi:hypothetical protein
LLQPYRGKLASDSQQLQEQVAQQLPEQQQPIRVAVIGRPNVGKSTFVNAASGGSRQLLVGPEPGITRDSIEVSHVTRVMRNAAAMPVRPRVSAGTSPPKRPVFCVCRYRWSAAKVCPLYVSLFDSIAVQVLRLSRLFHRAKVESRGDAVEQIASWHRCMLCVLIFSRFCH